MSKQPFLVCALLASASMAQVPLSSTPHGLNVVAPQARDGWPFDHVLHDAPGDGRLWAVGATYKASFGAEGVSYVPRLAPKVRSTALRLRLDAVRVDGDLVPLDAAVVPVREQDRITFERGCVREVYDLTLNGVEQSFVVEAGPGDVDVEIAVDSELPAQIGPSGVSFAGVDGGTEYGAAFLLRDGGKRSIATSFDGRSLRLHVAAAERGAGPVVIDPLISTRQGAPASALSNPDVAYDATNDRYLMVWEYEFSEFDHDVYSQAFDGRGDPIPGTDAPFDATTTFVTHPRIANLDAFDRFMVVMTVADPQQQGRMMIHGRMREAAGTMTMHAAQLLSDPALPGENFLPDIGADPGTDAQNHDWLVVWASSQSGSVAHIQGRLVIGDGQLRNQNVLPIQTSAQRNWSVSVSRSNGNGIVPSPQWLVVYTRTTSGSGSDIYLRSVRPDGTVGAEKIVDDSGNDDHDPYVSSPVDHGNGQTTYLVVYERPNATRAMWRRVSSGGLEVSQFFDLAADFFLGRHSPRVDSDGKRFVISTSSVGPTSSVSDTTRLCTLAWNGFSVSLQDLVIVPGVVHEPRITALRSSGGLGSVYGVAYLELVNGLHQPMLARYGGHASGTTTSVLPTACDGLGIAFDGIPALGNRLRFTLSNSGVNQPGFLFGGAAASAIPICSTCGLGVRLDLPILTAFGSPLYEIPIPYDLSLVGVSLAVQGLTVGSGSCFASLRFSDTVQFTIR